MSNQTALVEKSNRRITLADVARRASVSPSTASLVLSGKAKTVSLSDVVIERVWEVAKELDYSPNLLVRNMQRGRTNILTFFNCFRYVPHISNQYCLRLAIATNRAAGPLKYNVLTVCDFLGTTDETYDSLNGGHCDGVILFAPMPDDPLLARFRASRLPVVLLGREDTQGMLSSVRDDMSDGMRQAVDRLSELGHRRIATVDLVNMNNPNSAERIQALQSNCDAHGIELAKVIPLPDPYLVADGTVAPSIKRAIDEILGMDDAPTAIFCVQDLVATSAVSYCESRGVRVPEDLSIIGYDGIEWPGYTNHKIATVRVDLDTQAHRAVAILDDLITERIQGPVIERHAVQFVDGTTLAAPRNR
jgi:DNA-binding LacI/PurR family transcriptional regulator